MLYFHICVCYRYQTFSKFIGSNSHSLYFEVFLYHGMLLSFISKKMKTIQKVLSLKFPIFEIKTWKPSN